MDTREQQIQDAINQAKGSRKKFYAAGVAAVVLIAAIFLIFGNPTTNSDTGDRGSAASLSPVANSDIATISQNSGANSIDILSNDEGATAITSVTQGAHGSVEIAGNALIYTPDQGFAGTDSFTYTISNGNGASVGTVSVNVANLCSPNPCTSPPSKACNGSSLITYGSPAACAQSGDSYLCGNYPSSSAICPNGCSNGACNAAANSTANSTCVGVTCSSPPANKCIGNISVIYASSGICISGNCLYTNSSTACASGCAGAGVCQNNTCSPNPCTNPPAAACNGNNITTYNSTAACAINGSSYTCGVYNNSSMTCISQTCNGTARLYGGTCSAGACAFTQSDPCNTPPGATCLNSSTLRTFNSSGCSIGMCQYPPTDTNCQFGCASGQCSPQIVKEFNVTAVQFSFSPSIITVNQWDFVILNLTSTDVTHGFSLTAFGVSEVLSPGVSKIVNFTANTIGNFTFFCSVSCGAGHSGMTGTFTVNP